MSRNTSNSSVSTATTTNGLARTRSVKTNNAPAPLSSDIKLFVTNLRLLDLDLHPDWPNITVQTFSSKNADQKQRIGGVEWSLFRLFEIWDPQETSQKLQPFFPPLEPLQSLNLRAALYRCLNDLKKNGVLGRESVLRKTMLDECKGDRFFEVLALFSNVVLKRALAAQHVMEERTAVARRLALATALPKDKQASLLPLAIAHRAALVNVLKRKEEKRRRFKDFEVLLSSKAADIDRKIMQCKATPQTQRNPVSEKDAATIKKQLRDNWIGDQRWLEIILHGNSAQADDVFLSMQFDEVWPMVEQGLRPEDAVPEVGLLESLQMRVQEQQARLQKWKSFHDNIRQEKPVENAQDSKARAIVKKLSFDDHLKLQVRPSKHLDDVPVQRGPLRPEYQDILADMDADLLQVSKSTYHRSTAPQLTRNAPVLNTSRSPPRRNIVPKQPVTKVLELPTLPAKRELPQRRAIPQTTASFPRRQAPAVTVTPLDSEATLVGHPSTVLRPAPSLPHTVEPQMVDDQPSGRQLVVQEASDPLPMPSPVDVPSSSPSPQPSSNWPSEPPVLEPPFINTEDALAEQIIFSIGNATPSPVKKQPRLSLMERTRMSMAHAMAFEPTIEPPSQDSPQLPELSPERAPPIDNQASLLERTRLSMAAMSLKPRPSQSKKDKRKSTSRQSLFPVNQFDTPRSRKSMQAIEEASSANLTPKEVLFSDDVDYKTVFKSRPKVAHSPIFSTPAIGEGDDDGGGQVLDLNRDMSGLGISSYDCDDEFDEGVTGVDLADVEAEDEDGFTQAWDNSPSRRRVG